MSESIDLRELFIENPELRRNLQIELSLRRMFTAGIITALYALIVLPSLLSANRTYPQGGITQYLLVLLWSQKITLTLGGAISCWRAVRRERELNTWDFQRITRLSPLELAVGKLFGAPALAYFVTLCLAIPAILSAATTSPDAIALLWRSYILLFTGSLVVHAFALMISTVSEKGGAVSGLLILLLLQIFPLIGWLAIVQHMSSTQNPKIVAGTGELHFYGIPLPPTVLWATLELGFVGWLLTAVVRNIKLELEAIQLFSLRQGIGFALYCNFVWIGFYPWRATAANPLGTLLLWCVLIFYIVAIGVLQTRELVRRELRETGAIASAPAKLLMPISSILAAAALTSLVVVIFAQQLSLVGLGVDTSRNPFFLLFYFTAWLARDLFYLQWMNVRPVRTPMRKAFLYLGIFYVSTSIVFRASLISSPPNAAAFSAWLAPFAVLRTWTNLEWGSAVGAWLLALFVQIASAAGFAYLYRQQIVALAPRPYAAPPSPPARLPSVART